MTISKILATSAVVGLMSSAAFANGINFEQSGGSVGAVTFTQTGTGNIISANGTTVAEAASVVGSLDTLTLEQIGSNNESSFAIGTVGNPMASGNVRLRLEGSTNTSKLTVDQASTGTLDFLFGVQGDNNKIDANITAETSVVNIESRGDGFDYDIDQTASATGEVNSITANFVQSGLSGAIDVTLAQSGKLNTITLGAPSAFGTFAGTGGMTLNGGATVSITQTAANASYTATQNVAAGGSVIVAQN